MEPYSYVGNNPINFTDPTGMSKENYDPPTEGNFANGTVHKDDTGSWTYNDGIWEDNSGGGNNFGGELFIDARGNNSESYSGNRIDCVSCHHSTTFGNGTANNSAYDRYTIWGYNRTGGDDEKSMRGQNVNAISYSISDVSLMGVGGGSLKGLNTVSQLGKILQHWTSAASGAVALGEDPNIKKAVKNMQRININFLPPSPYNNAAIHIGKPKDTLVPSGSEKLIKALNFRDSLREVKKYNNYKSN